MRTAILNRAWRAFGPAQPILQSRGVIVMAALLLAAANLYAIPTGVSVTTLGGGNPHVSPKYLGYEDGITLSQALFHTPCGIALDSSGQYLFVADRDNNAIRYLDLVAGWTWTFGITDTNLISKPIAVALDTFDDVYVLNRGNGTNGSVVIFDNWGDTVAINAVKLTNATGMSLDNAGNIYLTVQSNKLIRIAAGTTNQTTITTIPNAGTSLQGIVVKQNGLIAACDSGNNGIWLINPSTPNSYSALAGFHGTGDFVTNGNNIASPSTAKFNQPMCVVEAGDGTLIVTDNGNNRVKAVLPNGVVTNLYGITRQYWGGSYPGWYDGTVSVPDSITPNAQSRLPFGIAIASDGSLFTTEDYYHIIRHVTGASLVPRVYPPLQPAGLSATAGYGQVVLQWAASSGATNYNIKRSLVSGGPYTNNIIGTSTTATYTDTNIVDGTTYYYVVSAVNTGGESANSSEASATPLYSPTPTIMSVATNYGQVSLTWSMSAGATSYNIKRAQTTNGPFTTIGSSSGTSYTDTTVNNGGTYYYVVSAVNPGGESPNSAFVSATPPLPPVPDPEIGYVDFPATSTPIAYTSVFHEFSSAVFYNDALIVIKGTPLTSTYYTYGYTTNASLVPDPTTASAPISSGYQDGLTSVAAVMPYVVSNEAPYLTIKAMGAKADGSPNSAVVQASIQFITGNPNINGINAAQFTLSDITIGANLYYTLDGSIPSSTNPAAINLGTNTNSLWTVSLTINTDTVFTVIALRDNFQPSAIVTNLFYYTNFVPNTISFGFAAGEASSAFVASPGQTFYAPVTLSVLSSTLMYSLQFNLTVTNISPAPTAPILPGTYDFESMLVKPIPNESDLYEQIPPWMFEADAINPPPGPLLTLDGQQAFISLVTTNTADNLLGVGWLERITETNLYNTLAQDLIQYSMAHDDLFNQSGGEVIVGGYNFFVPTNADPSQVYQIQIGRPSATSDGIGAPGSSVFIYAPTNGSLGGGAINSIKYVTIGQLKYIVGNVYPFRWFNAGDFGNTNLQSADVEQVFQSAIYGLNYPPPGSDFFDAMDSCGSFGVLDGDTGYYTNANNTLNAGQKNALFNGNDSTINQIAFGDGVLDVCDVYVTFRRSIEESNTTYWFQRYWTNGVRVAEIAPNVFNPGVAKQSAVASPMALPALTAGNTSVTNQPSVNFTAGDFQATAGSTIQIPITASIFGNYPLRVLMLNLTVVPLDGSPALTTPVSFSYNSALGSPWTTEQMGNGNYSAVWLNSGISGLTGNAAIGTLTVTIPTNATSLSAYAVHFDHASASPNGIASFPKQTLTGVIALSSRTNSTYGDGIPDLWRLRWFGTVNNLLSVSNACPSGDGINNWQKYVAGVDPNTPNDFPSLNPATPLPSGSTAAIYWPSVSGKQYAIERSISLFPGSWTAIATNIGTGAVMEFNDSASGSVRFYRVQILP